MPKRLKWHLTIFKRIECIIKPYLSGGVIENVKPSRVALFRCS